MAAGIFINITNQSRTKLGGRDQSKTVGEILSLMNKQAGQLMGYRHNTGQNKTIANAISDTLTRAHTLVTSVCAAAAVGVDTSEETAGWV